MCTTAEALQTSHRTTTHALFLARLSEVPARLQEQRQQAEKLLKLERSAPKIGQVVNGLSSESAAARTNPRNLVNIFPISHPRIQWYRGVCKLLMRELRAESGGRKF